MSEKIKEESQTSEEPEKKENANRVFWNPEEPTKVEKLEARVSGGVPLYPEEGGYKGITGRLEKLTEEMDYSDKLFRVLDEIDDDKTLTPLHRKELYDDIKRKIGERSKKQHKEKIEKIK